MREVIEIAVHTSATPVGLDIGYVEIRKWHTDKGWSDIGYHYVIRRDGIMEAGRPLEQQGAHVEGHNAKSIGICLVGGLKADGKTPDFNYTRAQMRALEWLLTDLLKRWPNAIVKGHRDYPDVKKACPCFDVGAWWYGQTQPIREGATS